MRASVLILAFFCASCAPKIARNLGFLENQYGSVAVEELLQVARQKTYASQYPFVVVLEKRSYQLDKNLTLTTQVHQIVQVLSKKAVADSKTKIIYYRAPYQKITALEAYTLSTDRKKYPAQVHDERPFFNNIAQFPLYKDVHAKLLLFDQLREGCFLYLRYQMESDCMEFCHSIAGELYVKNYVPVLKQKVIVTVPKGYPVHVQSPEHGRFQHILSDTQEHYILEHDHSEIIPREPLQKPLEQISPSMRFSLNPQWQNLNKQLYAAFTAARRSSPEIIAKAQALVSGDSVSRDLQVQAVYEYVTRPENIANVAVPFAVRGYVPHDPKDVLSAGYADALDKCAVMIALLHAVGVPAYFALMNEDYDVDWGVGALSSVNRVLVAVPLAEKYLFLDPYSAIVAFPNLPAKYSGKNVLVVRENAPDFARIPLLSAQENQIVYLTTATLNPQAKLSYVTEVQPQGSYETHERMRMIQIMLHNKSQSLEENYAAVFQTDFISLRQLHAADPFDIAVPYVYSVEFEVDYAQAVEKSSLTLNMDLHQLAFAQFPRIRHSDLFFYLPFRVVSKHYLSLDPVWTVDYVPPDVRIAAEKWAYSRLITVQGRQVVFQRVFELLVPLVPQQEYPEFRRFIQEVIAADLQFLVLQKP